MNHVGRMAMLIVCSDDRANSLARVLADLATVFKRSSSEDDAEWETFIYLGDSAWQSITDDKLPRELDALFFHVGRGDPQGVPAACRFRKEFAFSSPGLPRRSAISSREQAIPIVRPFVEGDCPVKARHLSELREYIEGTRGEVPAFCRFEERVPSLWAFAILCQGYAAAGIADGSIPVDDAFTQVLGWDLLEADTISRLSGPLAGLWPDVQTSAWWRRSLGIEDVEKNEVAPAKARAFLSRLVQDFEIVRVATPEDSLDAVASSLGRRTNVSKFLGMLLRESEMKRGCVEDAYSEVKAFLEER